jgi:hypothetical protein
VTEPVFAIGFVFIVSVMGYAKIRGRHSAPASIRLSPAEVPVEGEFAQLCGALAELGFQSVGDYAIGASFGPGQSTRTVMRMFLGPDHTAYAVAYQLLHLHRGEGVSSAARRVWIDLVSLFPEEKALTTASTAESIFAPNPDTPVRRFPGVRSAGALWRAHQQGIEKVGFGLPVELTAADIVPRFERAWTRTFEFQESRGLYRREGDRFVATGKLALRGIARFWLPVLDGHAARWLVRFVAVAAPTLAAQALLHLSRAPPEQRYSLPAVAGGALGALFSPRIEMWCVLLAGLESWMEGADDWGFGAALFAGAWATSIALNALEVRRVERLLRGG